MAASGELGFSWWTVAAAGQDWERTSACRCDDYRPGSLITPTGRRRLTFSGRSMQEEYRLLIMNLIMVATNWLEDVTERLMPTSFGLVNVRVGGRTEGPAMVCWPSLMMDGTMWRYP